MSLLEPFQDSLFDETLKMGGDLSGQFAALDQDSEFHVEAERVLGQVGAGD